MKYKALLINPPVYDFAAFNLWARPIGILYIASLLEKIDFDVQYIDCLSAEYETQVLKQEKKIITSKVKKDSTSAYFKKIVSKPKVYEEVKRNYYRYGIGKLSLEKILLEKEKPDIVLVTSIMTYWYPGVFEIIKTVKKIFKKVPVILGGIYASLCSEHAETKSGADYIIKGKKYDELIKCLCRIFNDDSILKKYSKFIKNNFPIKLYPKLDFYNNNNYIPILTSYGCINNCRYCASSYLDVKYMERDYNDVYDEVIYWRNKYDVKDIAFYDDALLYNKEKKIIPFLKLIANGKYKFNFHTPNGMHIRYINKELSFLMKEAGFKTLRFGFESLLKKIIKFSDNKYTESDFENALRNLFDAGFDTDQIGMYILIGLPGQKKKDVMRTVKYLKSLDLKIKFCQFSPIPHTKYFEQSKKKAAVDIENEPLYHNNSTLYLWNPDFSFELINEIKNSINFKKNS